jgi:hypothetical protein
MSTKINIQVNDNETVIEFQGAGEELAMEFVRIFYHDQDLLKIIKVAVEAYEEVTKIINN